jgi:chemotaxis protein CheC
MFTPLEIDTLKEIMNMAFGQAAAELGDVVDVFVQLTTPQVRVIPVADLPAVLDGEVEHFSDASVVEQEYRGHSDGMALLVFPEGAEKQLISFFDTQVGSLDRGEVMLELEREILLEVGNILIGACLGRLFELLKRSIYYLPPRITSGHAVDRLLSDGVFSSDDFAITLRADFGFEDRAVSGQLFLINRQQSVAELKAAMAEFWDQYR